MRQIYIVNATQVVISDSHPEGLWSVKQNYPKTFDSLRYNSDEEAFNAAESDYRSLESAMLIDSNPSRAMQAITLEYANGKSIYHRSKGSLPIPAPEPEPEPEPEEE